MECLLSIVEIMQFQIWLGQYMDVGNNDDDEIKVEQPDENEDVSDFRVIVFSEKIPQSAIIESKEELDKYNIDSNVDKDGVLIQAKIKAHKLYEKYINTGSEFEINISSAQRMMIVSIIDDFDRFISRDNITLKDMRDLFEDSKEEMWKLLQYSFTRFRFTDEFEEVVQLFGNKQTENALESIGFV